MSRPYGRRVPANTRETRSTFNLKRKTVDGIINELQNSQSSRLHTLVPELMNRVLELILISDEPVRISKFGRHQMPGILQVSRQLREQGLKMYYKNNHFRAIITSEHPDGPMKWSVEIASSNISYISSFTFDYRLTKLDYRLWFLRLSRTDEENQENPDRLTLLCTNIRRQVGTWMFKFDAPFGQRPSRVRLFVDFRTQDIAAKLRLGRKGLRTHLSVPIAMLVVLVEALMEFDPNEVPASQGSVDNAICRGTAWRSHRECWEMVFL